MAKPREIRITFKEKEADLYDYIQEKSSASAFLKDLAKLEKKKEEIYLNNLTSSDISDKILSSQKTNSIEYKEKEETLVLPDISDLED
ncbi:hypothetical protein QTH34_14455 [Clostridium perfringens]|jgi:hypothetical protein|uniref:Uncharacterized protein n=4 Tax=Clostridium perfringens TaxID=1502 RepID=A0A0N9L0S3_CLOPF|nr:MULTISPECIES: hypothetical protein [Clostridia]MDU7016676.1 hypothetical protein [Enterobacter sp.]AKF16705.1 hypothetical protein [Clostridium perfringens]ALD82563.1 hypothetical protein JFP838_pB0029 [Clostridium perfringens]ALG50290.1 hypothetical protein FORC3_p024 [Clostridium perfringens]AMN30541.1 hypothetical protein JFP838_pD0018 [Clostridium perfringens]